MKDCNKPQFVGAAIGRPSVNIRSDGKERECKMEYFHCYRAGYRNTDTHDLNAAQKLSKYFVLSRAR